MAMCKEKREWERQVAREAVLDSLISDPEASVDAIREQVTVVTQYANKLLGVDAEAVQDVRTAIYA